MKKLIDRSLLFAAILGTIVFASCNDDEGTAEIMPDAGTISGGPFSFNVDGVADFVSGITTDGSGVGANSSWIITDDQNTILGTPPTIEDLEAVNFDAPGVGTCFIWYMRYEGTLTGFEAGESVANLDGNFDISNSITVNRLQTGATLTGGPFFFVVDGEADNIPEDGITIANAGTDHGNNGWIVTNEDGDILGLPPSFTGPEFDAAGAGLCLVWYISYEDGLTGLTVGENTEDLNGVFVLSNAISVYRLDAPTLTGGPFTFTVSDGVADNLAADDITVDGGFAPMGQSSWVVTNEGGDILGLPDSFTDVNFDGAGEGVCFVWYITYGDDFTGLMVDSNVSGFTGTYELSNGIEVNRIIAAQIAGGPFNFVVDGVADNLVANDITIESSGTDLGESGWVVTDEDGLILGLPGAITGPEFDAAGPGTCLIWYINYEEGLAGLELGENANDLDGVFALSNPISVNRLDAPTLTGGPFTFTVGDGVADNIPEGGITVIGGYALEGQSSWIVTDDAGVILGLPDAFTGPNFDEAGVGTCLIWYITYAEGLTRLTVENNVSGLQGTFEISNSIEIIRQ